MIAHLSTEAIIAAESAHTSGVYPKRPIAIVRGAGARLWDAEGREYIDCVGGQGSANLGHANPAVVAAIHAQADTLIQGFSHIPYDKLDALDAAVDDRTAAVLIELVQGEGGVRPAGAEYVAGVARICRERGALLVVDEVQTGFGRTGRLWASQHYGI